MLCILRLSILSHDHFLLTTATANNQLKLPLSCKHWFNMIFFFIFGSYLLALAGWMFLYVVNEGTEQQSIGRSVYVQSYTRVGSVAGPEAGTWALGAVGFGVIYFQLHLYVFFFCFILSVFVCYLSHSHYAWLGTLSLQFLLSDCGRADLILLKRFSPNTCWILIWYILQTVD